MSIAVQPLSIQDSTEYREFLVEQAPCSMSMLYDLRHGITPDKKKDENAAYAEWFGAFDGKGALVGVVAQGANGNVQVCSPNHSAISPLAEAWAALRREEPRTFKYFLGPARHVELFRNVVGIGAKALLGGGGTFDFFTLNLTDMIGPPVLKQSGVVVERAKRKDINTISLFRQDYHVEEDGAEKNAATLLDAKKEMTRRIVDEENKDIFVLRRNGHRCAFGGADVFTPKTDKTSSVWAKIGPVFVPEIQRRKGYARGITAGALDLLAQEKGVTHAALFVNNPYAKKAYTALNFNVHPERWRLDYLKAPMLTRCVL